MDNKKREEISDEYKWDLSKMFKDENEYNNSLNEVNKYIDKVLSYKGKIMESSNTLLNFYRDYELMERLWDKIIIYPRLLCDTDTSNSKYQELKMKWSLINLILA